MRRVKPNQRDTVGHGKSGSAGLAVVFLPNVLMSNVYILTTTYRRAPSNDVVQTKFRTPVYTWSFPKSTKLVVDSSVVDLPNVKFESPFGPNTKTYEGKDALDQLRKMGAKLPDDIDMKKAVGRER